MGIKNNNKLSTGLNNNSAKVYFDSFYGLNISRYVCTIPIIGLDDIAGVLQIMARTARESRLPTCALNIFTAAGCVGYCVVEMFGLNFLRLINLPHS